MFQKQIRKALNSKIPVPLLLFLLLALQTSNLDAQVNELPFLSGENVQYGAFYNWHFVWINAGDVTFKCNASNYKNQAAWSFNAIGKTFKAYDIFYMVRDTFESYVSFPGFDPLWFRRSVNHGSSNSLHQYTFSKENGKIYSNIQRVNQQAFSSQQAYIPGVLDLLSSAYQFRGYDFENMKSGQKLNFTMLIDNKIEDLYFRYQGIEEIKTREGRTFRCHKVSVCLLEGDFFPAGEHMKIWFTADKNHLPIMVETKIQIGSVKAIFLGAEHLKYPLTSEISH